MAIYLVIYSLIGALPLLFTKLFSEKEKRNKWYAWIGFIFIFLVLALRHQSMGVDLGYDSNTGYLAAFDKIARFSWKEAFQVDVYNYERGYILFNKLISSIWNNRQFFLAVCAFISIVPVAFVVYKKSKDSIFSYFIYLGLPSFLMAFSGLRQSIAMGICFLSFLFIEDKKWVKFIITVLVASLFHYSAIIFLIAYPLYHINIGFKGRIFSLILLPVIFVLRFPLFSVLSKIFKEDAVPDNNGALTLLLVFCLIYVFCFFFAKKDKQINGLLNLFYIACCCQIFGNIYSTAMRVGYYFMPFAILLEPPIVNEMNDEKNVRAGVKIAILIAFIAFGLFSFYTSSWAGTYPYYWFWS